MIDIQRAGRSLRRAFVLGAVTLIACVASSPPAAAHADDGVIEVSAAPAGRIVGYDVLVTYVGDGHPAQDATATVVAEQAGRDPLGPIVLDATGEPGRYRALITFPADGTWTVRFSSLSPTAYLERTEIIAVSPAVATSAVVAVASTTTTPVASSRTAVTTGLAQSSTTATGSAPEKGDDGKGTGGSGSVVFFVLVGVIAAGATWLVASSKRRRTKAARS